MGGDLRRLYVGRDAEMAALEREFELAARGNFRCVVIDGPPGIGKTRLAGEFVRRKRNSAIGLPARAHVLGAGTAFGLWGAAFDAYLRERPAAEVREMCGGLVDDLAGLLRTAAAVHGSWRSGVPPAQLCQAMATLLANIARQRPVIIVLDDAHLADASSWEALSYLADNVPKGRVLVLVVLRLPELSETSPGWRAILTLEQGGMLSRLEIPPLGEAGLRGLAARALDRKTPPPELVAWLERQSSGNPLFAVTLLDELVQRGSDLTEPRLDAAPRSLSDWIRIRLASLDGTAREIAEILAVFGRQTDITELRRVTPHGARRLEEALSRLVSAGLATEQRLAATDRYEISHPVVVDTINDRLPRARRLDLHRSVARVLAADDRPDEAALHFVRASEPGDAEAIRVVVGALRHTWSQRTYPEAFRILRALTELVLDGDHHWLDVLDAMPLDHEWTSIYNRLNIDIEAGIRTFQEVERVLVDNNESESSRTASVRLRLAGFLGWGRGEIEPATALLESAADLFARNGQPEWSLVATTELSWMYALGGRYQEQAATARRALAAARETGDARAEMFALGSLGNADNVRGRFTEAQQSLRRSIKVARGAGDRGRLAFGLSILGLTFGLEGRLTEARALLDEARGSSPAADPLALAGQTQLAYLAGDFPQVRDLATRLLTLLSGTQRAFPATMLAIAAVEGGEFPVARRHLRVSGEVLTRRLWMMKENHELALGLASWAEGDPAAAARRLQDAASALLDDGALPYAALLLVEHAEAALDATDAAACRWAADRSAEVANRIDRDLYRCLAAMTAACAALATQDSAGAATAAGSAHSLLSDSGYRVLEARSLGLLGRALAASDQQEAVTVLQAAAELFAAGGAWWRHDRVLATLGELGKPGQRVVAGVRGPAALTAREREVTVLATQGLTARRIGEELHIGTRTVETHLANAYAKLGVRSRAQLAEVLREWDAPSAAGAGG